MIDYIKREPVRFWAAVTGIIMALFPVLTLFGVIDWSVDQIAAVLALFAAIGVTFQFFFVRNKVSPID